MTRHFLDLWQVPAPDLRAILEDAKARKAARCGWPKGRPDAGAPFLSLSRRAEETLISETIWCPPPMSITTSLITEPLRIETTLPTNWLRALSAMAGHCGRREIRCKSASAALRPGFRPFG